MYIQIKYIMNNKKFCIPVALLISLTLSGCQTHMDKQYNFLEPSKGKSVICHSQQDSIELSKRAYTDNNKVSKSLALFPKIRKKSCMIIDSNEFVVLTYSPKIEFRLSDEGLDSYYSPIHKIDKVEYRNESYWLVR